ncbi:MAG TPA: M56 family metallopeptidase [Flavipsychrobacter sp.]|nr:M56 family metallopeptidase [Flavipsychrobacter sp.]
MLYAIQTMVYATLFYAVYALLLKDKPVHRFNRMYLLLSAIMPFVLPLLKFNSFIQQDSPVTKYLGIRMPEVSITDAGIAGQQTSYTPEITAGYMAISCIFFAILIYQWMKLNSIVRKAEKIKMEEYTLLINTRYGPGSWRHFIFLPDATADERIIAHEAAHVRFRHTADFTLISILQCVFWYNPLMHWIKKELKQVHEFEADNAVSSDTQSYQELLVNHFLQQCQLPFTHSFINHPIKRRIMMLNKNKNGKKQAWRFALTIASVLFLFGNLIWFQNCKAKNWEVKNEIPAKLTKNEKADSIFNYVKKMPEPTTSINQILIENLVYPEEAKKNKIEGKVIVKFVVNKEGKVINPQVIQSPGEALSKEALRVTLLMPDWIPGENEDGEKVDVYFTQPILFKLEEKEKS